MINFLLTEHVLYRVTEPKNMFRRLFCYVIVKTLIAFYEIGL